MAILKETDPARYDMTVDGGRVLPDLARKLPSLFGPDASTTMKDVISGDGVGFSVAFMHYPKEYVVLTATPPESARMSPMYVHFYDLFPSGMEWHASVSGSIDHEHGISIAWQGAFNEPRAKTLSIAWPRSLPSFEFSAGPRTVTATNPDRGSQTIAFDEIIGRTKRYRTWLDDAHFRTRRCLEDLAIDPTENTLTATLTGGGLPVFPLRLPLMVDVNRVDGHTSRLHKQLHP